MPNVDNTTHDQLERAVADIDLRALLAARRARNPAQPFFRSPDAWEDQVLYFLMLDRFSDGREQGTRPGGAPVFLDNDGNVVAGGGTSPFSYPGDAYTADRGAWYDAGGKWCGGTLKGLTSKLGYIKRLGATAIWVSPVFKQVDKTFDAGSANLVDANSYHGYGTQNFLDVDPHFGTRQDLIDLVAEAHRLGIYVILDIIVNHAGDVFQYAADRYDFKPNGEPLGRDRHGQPIMDPRWDNGSYTTLGFRNAFGAAVLPYGTVDQTAFPNAWPNDAVWPADLQAAQTFTRKGRIENWEHDPEFREGDFASLKDVDAGHHDRDGGGRRIPDSFHPSVALNALCEVYKFWVALADLDGFRLDTVKHMEPGAARYFASAIHEFAQSIGKENFYIIGEITGSRNFAFEVMETAGLDAALGVQDVDGTLEYLAKGYRNPEDYFDLFRNSQQVRHGSHTWFGRHVVTQLDDHDKVGSGRQQRRFAGDEVNRGWDFLVPAIALNLATLGIPCVYYGTEQAFDGGKGMGNDRYLRECMFGGPFGSLQSTGRHFFDESHAVYRQTAAIAAFRASRVELRRGRQYLRQISGDGVGFGYPRMIGGQLRSVVAWSRILSNRELLCAVNTDPDNASTAWVTIDDFLHQAGDTLTCVFSTRPADVGTAVAAAARNGKAIQITVPPAGFVAYE